MRCLAHRAKSSSIRSNRAVNNVGGPIVWGEWLGGTNEPSRPVTVALTACGGGESSTSSAPVSDAPPPTQPVSVEVPGSTRLGDNPLGGGASFDNFSPSKPTIPVAEASFIGSRVYVKVNRIDGEVLFLGAVARNRNFTVPVHLPLGEEKLLYEIFSNSAEDQIVFGEVSL